MVPTPRRDAGRELQTPSNSQSAGAFVRRPSEHAMPRRSRRTEPLWPVVAVSVARLADALDISRSEIYEAIKDDALICYRKGVKRRILVADAIEWVRSTWPRVK
jgi:hypothetical protein